MSEILSRDFKKKYNHCKLRIKQWEANFSKENGRDPNKMDIKEAEPKIREYFKLYYRLKSSILEEQILGSSFDATAFEELSQSSNVLKEKSQEGELDAADVSKPGDSSSVRKAENGQVPKPASVKPSGFVKHKSETTVRHARKNRSPKKWLRSASSKLFEGTSFKIRNPRKALQKKSTPDLSSSRLNDSCEQSFMSEMSFQSCASPLPDMDASDLNFSVIHEISPKIKSLIESPAAFSPLFASMSKVKIVSAPTPTPSHPMSVLSQNLLKPKTARKLDVGWVERCSQVAEKGLEEGRTSLDSGFESTSGSFSSPFLDNPTLPANPEVVSSDDELICDSDDENSSQMVLSLKRKADSLDSSLPDKPSTSGEISKKVKFETAVPRQILSATTPTSSTTQPKAASSNQPAVASINRKDQVKKEILENKIKAGTLNENYVKINMKKKVFVRGKKTFNFGKHKKTEWKKKKRELDAGAEIGGVLRCFKCGDIGHYARYCQSGKEDKLLPMDDAFEDDLGLPSLEEAEEMAREAALALPVKKGAISLRLPEPEAPPEDLPDLEGVSLPVKTTAVPPLSPPREDVLCTLRQFGHEAFRGGQEAAVMRVLAGKSTLLMLSTGGGKSLCYQLPAYLYHKTSPSIALVVSPLVSLMDDQVIGSLPFLKLGCLHSNQTEKQRAVVIAQLEAGALAALLVSPEAVVSSDSFGFRSVLKKLPPIAFACIDEVHCVSQWSYNFRPSYLMLTKVLRERLNVKTFLGLTATASKTTVASIVKELGIDDSDGVIQDTPLPSHLHLAISRVAEKDQALLKLVKDSNGGAILVYCTRRDECVRLATLIRTVLRGVTAQAYHAGLVASRRKTVQRTFMQGKLQVVVATVAFGMGINKQDIRCVFHYNMPKDWESYVQEVGRAGRDGQPAHCHLLLDPKGSDLQELRRHIHSNSVERHVLRRLLARLFMPCTCQPGHCPGHEVAFSAAETVTNLDLPEENISTLLCYLELHKDNLVQMLTPAYMTCKLQSYHGARGIHRAARECPPLAVAAARTNETKKAACLTFDVIELARQIGWDSGTVKHHLKQTEWRRDKNNAWRRSGINVSFSDLGLRVRSRGDLSPEQLDEALNYLVQRVESQQSQALTLLQTVYSTFHHFATDLKDTENSSTSDEIKEAIRTYFKTEQMPENITQLKIQEEDFEEEVVVADVRHLVQTFRDNTFNGRAVARIFHGMQSPNYPASIWFRARQWRAHLNKPFDRLQKIATREILRLK